MLALSTILVTFCAYPLWRLSTLGSSGHHFREGDGVSPPDWFRGPPLAYVQQIIVRSAVMPWDSREAQLLDAFRGPLYTAFKVSELVSNHQYEHISNDTRRKISLHDLCLQVQESSPGVSGFLPQYSCLVVSPALIWNRDPQRFLQDPHIVDSLFGQHDTKELFFGLPWRETGLKRSCLRNRQRVLSYAVTLLLDRFDAKYIDSLRELLLKQFPLSPPPLSAADGGNVAPPGLNQTAQRSHLHFRYVHQLAEFLPLFVVYLLMAFYVYFSLSKVALLRSKILLAGATVATVFLSEIMAIGICLWLRLNPTLNGSPLVSPRAAPCAASEVLPYLLVIIGLENSLCITNSVVNCQPRGAKIHLAQGLSREGWSLVKTLLTELSLLTMAFFTFVPVVQEFCLYSLIGVVCDFVLQHLFFATLLSLDLQRKEKDDEGALVGYPRPGHPSTIRHARTTNKPMARVFAGQPTQTSVLDRVPRRLRLLYIWTRFRLVQRSLMAILMVWIVLLVQRSGVIESFRPLHAHNFTTSAQGSLATLNLMSVKELKDKMTLSLPKELFEKALRDSGTSRSGESNPRGSESGASGRAEDALALLKLRKSSWKELPTSHWTSLFGFYNMSLWGRYVTVLPEIHVAIPIAHSEAVKFRHPEDASFQFYPDWSLLPEPNESLEVLARPLFILLTIPTTLFIIYLLATLYRCVCSRNYAQWRSQWRTRGLEGAMTPPDDVKPPGPLCHETFPIRLSGHQLPIAHIECVPLRNDIISASLDGELRVWDAVTGECLKVLRRSSELRHDTVNKDVDGEAYAPHGGAVWAMACFEHWLVLSVVVTPSGAEGQGRLELWDTLEGRRHSYRVCESPIVALGAQRRCIAAASMFGQLMAFTIETSPGQQGHLVPSNSRTDACAHLAPCGVLKAHSQAVTFLCFPEEGTLLLTGSLDRLVKVFSLEPDIAAGDGAHFQNGPGSLTCVYTLHGHAGPISALHADERQAVSACLQGMLCLWDLLTGTCIYSVEAHRAAISSVCLSALYVVSCSALEANFRVWERTQGHLLHTRPTACRQAELLSDDVLVTAGGELLLWDVHRAEQLQMVQLGVQMGGETGVRLLRKANANTLVCDSANDLCVVYFPALTNKSE
ncbi:sterol regulatory element-binding protein cleavage-activating protein-like [Tropilaelaps mercedesae]|uniref:Sterol regulatory element-binding protein cleavage-activating protein n=1 Tax=Tropilaelaps mercedesae TaxID=418985 RepID=A0A1V9XFM9_9ACAR|nr:sterol regulatory element-binding protein cleavage-activating protein-like [Tropilaelaps mercedesae]